MKKILSAIVLCCSINMVNAQSADNNQARIEDNNHKTIATVKPSGSIYDKNNVLVCQIKGNGNILDGKSMPIGYITQDGAIQDAKHNTTGYIVNGASFQNAEHTTIISVKPDGAIVNGNGTVMGYEANTEAMWAGLYFFMFMR